MRNAFCRNSWRLLTALALVMLLCAGTALAEEYPESEHPYAANSDVSWSYTHTEEAYALEITFSEETYFESGWDFLYITDSAGTQQKFSGATLQGKSAMVLGNSFTLQLTSDSAVNYYGFAITGIEAATQAEYEEYLATPRYTINASGTITSYSGLATELVIPAEIDGVAVTAIGGSVFKGNAALESIALPEGVTSIGSYAFQSCTALNSVQIPGSLTSIGWYAFSGCTALTALELPEGLTTIESCAFYKCYNLASVNIPSTVTTLGGWAFADCRALTDAVVPEGVTVLGEYTFYYCLNLTSLELPSGLTSIGASALAGTALEELVLPDGVASIGSEVFWDYYYPERLYCNMGTPTAAALMEGGWKFIDPEHPDYWIRLLEDESEAVTIEIAGYLGDETALTISSEIEGMTVTAIGDSAFRSCTSLISMKIPDGVTSIGDYSFYYCSSLAQIELPDGLKSIGDYAFNDCSSLAQIELPDGLESIGNYAFAQNTVLVFGSSELIEAYASDNMLQYICDGKDVTYSDIDTVEEMVQWVVATYTTPDMSEYDRALCLYDWLCARAQYGYGGGYNVYRAEGPLLGGWSVCDGYARAYSALLAEADITAAYVTGPDHAWNLAKIDGDWYQFDVTWDESGNGADHEYFALTDTVMRLDHEQESGNHLICDSWEANYYYHTGALDAALASFRDQINESISAGTYSGSLDVTTAEIRSLPTNARFTLAYILGCESDWAVPGRVEIYPDQYVYATYSFQFYPDETAVTDIQIEGFAREAWSGYFLYPGYSVQMSVTTEPAGAAVTYASSDESVLTVSDTGLVTAHAVGQANLILSSGNYKMEIGLYCQERDDLYLSISGMSDKDIGETVQLYLYGTPVFLADDSIVWSSSDESVATVTQDGLVTALSYGTVNITVSSVLDLQDSERLCVRIPATAAYMDKAVYEGRLGDDYYITWWMEGCDQNTYHENYDNYLTHSMSKSLLGSYVGSLDPGSTWNEEAARWEYTERFWGTAVGAAVMQIWPSDDGDATPASAVIIVHSKSPMTLPSATREIQAEAFAGLAMDEVVLPDGVMSIGARAFADCASLKLVNLPDSLETIAADAFDGCSGVTLVCGEGSAAHAFAEAQSLNYVLVD